MNMTKSWTVTRVFFQWFEVVKELRSRWTDDTMIISFVLWAVFNLTLKTVSWLKLSIHILFLYVSLCSANFRKVQNAWNKIKCVSHINAPHFSPLCSCLFSRSIFLGTDCVVCVTDDQGQRYQAWFSVGTLVAPMPDSRGHAVWVGVSGEPRCLQMERVDGGTYLFKCRLVLYWMTQGYGGESQAVLHIHSRQNLVDFVKFQLFRSCFH